MFEDRDRLLDAIGIVLVLAILAGLGIGILAATSAPSRTADAPDTSWAFRQINDSHVSVAHAGGEPVEASALVVTVEGYNRHADWEGTVTEGDVAVVRASEGSLVRLYWEPGGRSQGPRVQLRQWRVSSASG